MGLEKPNSGLDPGETFFPNSVSDLDSAETFQISRNLGLDIDENVCLLDSQPWMQVGARDNQYRHVGTRFKQRYRKAGGICRHQDQTAIETGRGRDLQAGATDKEPLGQAGVRDTQGPRRN